MKKAAAQMSDYFRLDPATGKLYWRKSPNRRICIGREAGKLNEKGYRIIILAGVMYRAHWIVWAITHGCWPKEQLDHINLVKDDNRPENLRQATNLQNQWNRNNSHAVSGRRGVYRNKEKWAARIQVQKRVIALGVFDTVEAAATAYDLASLRFRGEFACKNSPRVASHAGAVAPENVCLAELTRAGLTGADSEPGSSVCQ